MYSSHIPTTGLMLNIFCWFCYVCFWLHKIDRHHVFLSTTEWIIKLEYVNVCVCIYIVVGKPTSRAHICGIYVSLTCFRSEINSKVYTLCHSIYLMVWFSGNLEDRNQHWTTRSKLRNCVSIAHVVMVEEVTRCSRLLWWRSPTRWENPANHSLLRTILAPCVVTSSVCAVM